MSSAVEAAQKWDLKWTTWIFYNFGLGRKAVSKKIDDEQNAAALAKNDKMTFMFWEAVCLTGDGAFWFGALPVSYLLWHKGDYMVFTQPKPALILACLIADLLVLVPLKTSVRRKRPSHSNGDIRYSHGPDKFSFPSGHATRSWALAAIASLILAPEQGSASSLAVTAQAAAWAAFVCLGRVSLGRHYLSDVIAGSLVGAFLVAPFSLSLHAYFFPPS